MKYLNQEIENELKNQGAELIRFVNISHLDEKQNRQLPTAIVFALPLTAEYVKMVFNMPDYVQARIADNYNFDDDEYLQTEHKAGEIADELAKFIIGKGYKAISQSDTGLLADGVFDYETKESVLPHAEGANSEVMITEKLLTHADQHAVSEMDVILNGEGSRTRVISRSVAKEASTQVFYPRVQGNAPCFGHVSCDAIIMGTAKVRAIPEISCNHVDAGLIHEAAIGRIAGEQLLKLETLGLTPEEAEEKILEGFLR